MGSKHLEETKEERKLRRQRKKELKERKKRSRDESAEEVTSSGVEPIKKIKAEEIVSDPQIEKTHNEDHTEIEEIISNPQIEKSRTQGHTEIEGIVSNPQIEKSCTEGHTENLSKSPFQQRTIRCMISLQPHALSHLTKALNQSMRNLLLRYYASFGGVLLSFENLEIISKTNDGLQCGVVFNEMPHMNFMVRVDVLLFRPDVGIKLTGSVNESFPSHVGLLVHSLFNAMVNADHLRDAGYVFDTELNEWRKDNSDSEEDPTSGFGDSLGVGVDIEFAVEKLHEVNGVISLEGSEPKIIEHSSFQ
mmetsp:Transcript_20482/g.19708  ORF Transcript_20482/g.19708 Transcript_20482/m.19708 type:complete len:305 (-) Transcript_20482:350-1264(-)|eukprot:CAMPEP_0197837498 /NCGR_PEP_ID=MMETSP1437-20131217/32304_1 /TAXON_ID=49252 ORGANISM="Eucampia antarctica, Strain CCMP1452" /NCGR_SAMPLE_ID=MMETSP1437 /ASSEMBLY_ACC=CAM_ASM_001096 /LENGTH=304 /DNA_ID=CAMNT_0043444573 /DNA_START=82 /DNA_END=996 /DNA_ORIENTATION=+